MTADTITIRVSRSVLEPLHKAIAAHPLKPTVRTMVERGIALAVKELGK